MRVMLERHLSTGHHLRVVLESGDIPSHSVEKTVRADAGINLAMVNVLDVAESALLKTPLSAAADRATYGNNAVGGACGDDPQRDSDR